MRKLAVYDKVVGTCLSTETFEKGCITVQQFNKLWSEWYHVLKGKASIELSCMFIFKFLESFQVAVHLHVCRMLEEWFFFFSFFFFSFFFFSFFFFLFSFFFGWVGTEDISIMKTCQGCNNSSHDIIFF